MNLQITENGLYGYVNIGTWYEGLLDLNDNKLQMNMTKMVRSVCSEPCTIGQIKVSSTNVGPQAILMVGQLAGISYCFQLDFVSLLFNGNLE